MGGRQGMAMSSFQRASFVVGMLEMGPASYERVAARWRRARPVVYRLVTLAWLGCFGVALWRLGRAGNTGGAQGTGGISGTP